MCYPAGVGSGCTKEVVGELFGLYWVVEQRITTNETG
jgi:hypothetical protein